MFSRRLCRRGHLSSSLPYRTEANLRTRKKIRQHDRALAGNGEQVPAGRPQAGNGDGGIPGTIQNNFPHSSPSQDSAPGLRRTRRRAVAIAAGASSDGADARPSPFRPARPAGRRRKDRATAVDAAVRDQRAHEIAVAPFGGEIDRRRRALLAAADFAQIERLAEPALRLADSRIASPARFERERRDVVTSSIRPTPPIAGVGRIALPLVSL